MNRELALSVQCFLCWRVCSVLFIVSHLWPLLSFCLKTWQYLCRWSKILHHSICGALWLRLRFQYRRQPTHSPCLMLALRENACMPVGQSARKGVKCLRNNVKVEVCSSFHQRLWASLWRCCSFSEYRWHERAFACTLGQVKTTFLKPSCFLIFKC